MKNSTRKMVFLFLLLSLVAMPAMAKKRVAIIDLEDKSAGQHSGWHNVGSGMADSLTTALVKSGKFTVIEREKLQTILNEQQLGQSGAITAQSAAKVGQLLGAQYIITGSVTEFGIKESKLGVGKLGNVLGFGGGVDTRTNTAKVAIDVRIIDTSTGEIVLAEQGEGEESSTGVEIDLDIAPSVEFGKDGFDETVIGKAVRKAMEKILRTFTEAEAKLPWSAKIIKVDGNKVWLNVGSDDGITVGKEATILHKGEELIDPDTGISLGSSDSTLGKVKIVTVDKKFSVAETSVTGIGKNDIIKEIK